jgi:four helix bundle protein
MKSYRDLFVWRESISMVTEVYASINAFPAHEKFAMSSQIRRAAVSVPANIAEGQALYYRKGFLRHLYIARGSLAELRTLLTVSEQVGYLTSERYMELDAAVEGVARPLQRLIDKIHEEVEAEKSPRKKH